MSAESQEMILIAKLVKTLTDHLKIISKQSQSIKQLQELLEAQGTGQLIMLNLFLKNDELRRAYFSQEIEKIINQTDLSENPFLKELLQEYLKISSKQPTEPVQDAPKPSWFQGIIQGDKTLDEEPE